MKLVIPPLANPAPAAPQRERTPPLYGAAPPHVGSAAQDRTGPSQVQPSTLRQSFLFACSSRLPQIGPGARRIYWPAAEFSIEIEFCVLPNAQARQGRAVEFIAPSQRRHGRSLDLPH